MLHFCITVLIFLIVLTGLITVHELGHCLMAKLLGVRVIRFSVGFGKPLLRWQGGDGTEYVLSCIPLGGYVKMLEVADDEVLTEQSSTAFNRHSPIHKILIVLAGPLFNVVFAFFALWLMFVIGVQGVAPVIGQVQPFSIASLAHLKPNQQIIAIDGSTTQTWQAVVNRLMHRMGDHGLMTLKVRDLSSGAVTTHRLPLKFWTVDPKSPRLMATLGIYPKKPFVPAIIRTVIPKGPADRAGIRPGDKVIKVNGQEVQNFDQLSRLIGVNPSHKLMLTVMRQDRLISLSVVPELTSVARTKKVGRIGVESGPVQWSDDMLVKQRYFVFSGFTAALHKVGQYVHLSYNSLIKIITGRLSWQYVGGPISIAQGAGLSIRSGFVNFLEFLAFISVNLGILNLLPIPVLDGGYLVYYILELMRGKALPARIQLIGVRVGVFLLMSLMVIVCINDLMRF